MFKLGEYHEDDARDVAKYLRDAGMKVDIRTFTDSSVDTFDFLEGRMSELKGEIDEEKFNKYEQYISALRAVLAKGDTNENFKEMLQTELDPELSEKRAEFLKIVEDAIGGRNLRGGAGDEDA
jgi:hypothetical protein